MTYVASMSLYEIWKEKLAFYGNAKININSFEVVLAILDRYFVTKTDIN